MADEFHQDWQCGALIQADVLLASKLFKLRKHRDVLSQPVVVCLGFARRHIAWRMWPIQEKLRPLFFLESLDDFNFLLEILLQTQVVLPESVVLLLYLEMELDLLVWIAVASCIVNVEGEPIVLGFKPSVRFTKLLQTLHGLAHLCFPLHYFLFKVFNFLFLVGICFFDQLNVLLHFLHLLLGKLPVLLGVLGRLQQQLHLVLQLPVLLDLFLQLVLKL